MVIIMMILIGLILTILDPDQLSINYFSANELLNGGSNYVYYFGFDAFGNPISGTPYFNRLLWS